MLTLLAYRTSIAVLPWVPRPVGLRAAAALGGVLATVYPRRGAVRANIRHVLGPEAPDERVRSVAREVFRNQARNYFDLFHFAGLPASRVADVAVMANLDEMLAGQRDGKGTVAVTAHFGNLDIVGTMGPLAGLDAVVVVERLQPDSLFRLVSRIRGRTGLELVPVDAAPKHILRALRRNRMVVLAADRDAAGESVAATFFGASARVPDGYARLARRTGARLLVLHARRCADDTFELHGKLLPRFVPSDDPERDVSEIVASVLAVLEPVIADAPEQWVLFRSLWPSDDGAAPRPVASVPVPKGHRASAPACRRRRGRP